VSEVIESFIKRHPELAEKDAFDAFLREERIKAWVGADETRRERLRKEFDRVWGALHVEAAPAAQATSARSGPSGPVAAPRTVRIHVQAEPERERPDALPATGGRRLQVLCANCKHVDVWMDEQHVIQCRRCHRVYDDMLLLIRVTPVGPFEFVFGEGWKGAVVAGGIAAGLVGLYLFLRGF
jgi:hypothetical protein